MKDNNLIHLVKEGNSSGLSSLYEKYRNEYLGWIRKFSHCNEEDARELYQTTVLILYENILKGKVANLNSSLKTYLFAIGKHIVLQNYRKNNRYQQAKAEYMLEYHILYDQEDHEEVLEKEQDLDLVSRCLQQIGDPCHALLDLFYFHAKNMLEISIELGYKNPDTAKNQKYKCLERLRKIVEAERAHKTVEQN